MGNRAAVIKGTFLVPGVSKNKRLYTQENIGDAVNRMQQKLSSPDGLPLTMATSHGAAYTDDALSTVGRVTKVWQDLDSGKANFEADIANTTQGRDVAMLVSGDNPFLKTISIRGQFLSGAETIEHDGEKVLTAPQMDVVGIDFTNRPGVEGAQISDVELLTESHGGPVPILESFDDFEVQVDESSAPATISLVEFQERFSDFLAEMIEADTTPYGNVPYADPGYQADKKKRYPLDTAKRVRSAWSYINVSDNASKYTSAQVKRIKSRIKAAAGKFGIDIQEEYAAFLSDLHDVLEAYVSVTVDNGDALIQTSGSIYDPAKLAAMVDRMAAGATAALNAIDPDEDGDVDGVTDTDELPSYPMPEKAPVGDGEITESDPGSIIPDSGTNPMYCPNCDGALPDSATYCPACGQIVTAEPEKNPGEDQNNENKEALVPDQETVAETAAPEAPEAPARTLTESDLTALAAVLAEAIRPVVAAATPVAPTEEPAAPAVAETVATETPTEEAPVAETFDAETVKRLIAEAKAEAVEEAQAAAVDAYRSSATGASRKGYTTDTITEGDEAEYTLESLAKMDSSQFRQASFSVWESSPFFRSKWAQADATFGVNQF